MAIRKTAPRRRNVPKTTKQRRATHTKKFGAGSKLPARRGRNRR